MGQQDIRRLPMIGATAVIRRALRRGAPKETWLAGMLERNPIPVVAVALANKVARGICDMLAEDALTAGESLPDFVVVVEGYILVWLGGQGGIEGYVACHCDATVGHDIQDSVRFDVRITP